MFLLVQVRHSEKRYSGYFSLNLPGVHLLRLDESQVAVNRWLALNLNRNSETFLSNIGLNSLYFWTGKRAPSVVTLSTVVHLFADSVQQQLLTTLQSHDRGVFLYHDLLFQKLAKYDRTARESLLVREMRKSYEDRGAVKGFHFLTLKTQPPPILVDCGDWTDQRSFTVSIAPRPLQKLGRIALYNMHEKKEIPVVLISRLELQEIVEQTMNGTVLAVPIDLSEALKLDITLPESQVASGDPLLIRLYDENSRHIGSLPFLDRSEPPPSPDLDSSN